MSKKDLKELILSLSQDVIFIYNNIEYCINPFSKNKFEVATDKNVITYNDIEDLMSAEIFDNKSLNDISNDIKLY